MAYTYTNSPLLSKIKIGNTTYYLKDAEVRQILDTYGAAVTYNVDTTVAEDSANLITSGAVHKYVTDYVTDITGGAMTFVGIFATEEGKTNEEVLAEKVATPAAGYVAIVGTAEYVYADGAWRLYGDEGIYATIAGVDEAYVKKSLTIAGIDLKDNITAEELTTALKLGALAKKNSATGTVEGQTISGVKATGTTTGSIAVALTEGETAIASTGNYTPAGSVNGGKVIAAGTVDITVTNADAQATLATADYQPTGTVSVTLANAEINAVKSVGTQAQFTEGKFTEATLNYEDVTANYATEGLVGSVDNDECLVFTAAGVQALSASKVNSFTGGSKAADTFVANELPVAEKQTVGVDSSTFTGAVATGLKVTGVTYQRHDGATAKFTGNEVDVTGATFTGDAATIEVSGNGKTYAVDTNNTKFTGAAIELAVGDIEVSSKEVTVQ